MIVEDVRNTEAAELFTITGAAPRGLKAINAF